jgi:cytochrome c-type biogenesis protein CcmH
LLFVAALAFCGLVLGKEDPALEERVRALSLQLRCLVCQNQTLADSNAPLAEDLRNQIREQLGRGASEQEVVDFLVARYGDFVLYNPPLKASTVLLWAGPFLFLAFGILVLARRLKKGKSAQSRLTEDEHRRALRLLEGGEE